MGESELPDDDEDILADDEPVRPAPPPPRPGEPSEGFMAKAWAAQHAIERRWEGIGRGRIARVLRMARKPEPDEFRQSATIVLVGIAVIGGLGFFVYLLMQTLLRRVTPT